MTTTLTQRLKDVLVHGELHDDTFHLDRTAFSLSLAHRGGVIDALSLTEGTPKLGAQLVDCLAQDSSPMHRAQAVLAIADDIDDDDTNGRACDLLRKLAQDGGYR